MKAKEKFIEEKESANHAIDLLTANNEGGIFDYAIKRLQKIVVTLDELIEFYDKCVANS